MKTMSLKFSHVSQLKKYQIIMLFFLLLRLLLDEFFHDIERENSSLPGFCVMISTGWFSLSYFYSFGKDFLTFLKSESMKR